MTSVITNRTSFMHTSSLKQFWVSGSKDCRNVGSGETNCHDIRFVFNLGYLVAFSIGIKVLLVITMFDVSISVLFFKVNGALSGQGPSAFQGMHANASLGSSVTFLWDALNCSIVEWQENGC